ncbi:MAG: hypothetical protein ACRCX2_24745 [Paraclostridium sp.]
MLNFKDILYSKFKSVYPDLIEKDIVKLNEITTDKLENFNHDEYSVISRFYRGLIMDIPNGVTSDNLERNHPLTCYKDNDISFNKSNKLASCQGFLHGFVFTYLQVEQCGLLSLLVLGQYLMSLFQK